MQHRYEWDNEFPEKPPDEHGTVTDWRRRFGQSEMGRWQYKLLPPGQTG